MDMEGEKRPLSAEILEQERNPQCVWGAGEAAWQQQGGLTRENSKR